MLRLEENHFDNLSGRCCDVHLLKGQRVRVQKRVQVVPGVACQRVLLGLSWLEHEEPEAWDERIEIFLLHRGYLRVLVTQSHKVPEGSHLNQLRVELLADFLR